MPRHARMDAPGILNHVMSRGLEKKNIFLDEEDYNRFLTHLGELVLELKFKCFGWVLMPNHFHLLLETGPHPLSHLMSRLLTRYAVYFNQKHKRTGHLFQNRYKSILCDKEVYFKELIAYIHLNPITSGLRQSMKELLSFRWSGHRALMGVEKRPWQAIEETLSHFGQGSRGQRRNYLKFLSEKAKEKSVISSEKQIDPMGNLRAEIGHEKEEQKASDPRVLGGADFVRKVMILSKKNETNNSVKGKFSVDDILLKASKMCGIERNELLKPGKATQKGVVARSMASFLLIRRMGLKTVEVARILGISQPAVSVLCRRGEEFKSKAEALLV